jgi:hypothetical protein
LPPPRKRAPRYAELNVSLQDLAGPALITPLGVV